MDAGSAQALVAQTNAFRLSHGVPVVAADAPLLAAAHQHACDLARYNLLSHEPQHGNTPLRRAQAAGARHCLVVENIAQGPRRTTQVLAGWSARAGHRRNLLDARMTHLGVAAVEGPGGPRWVMVLGGPC